MNWERNRKVTERWFIEGTLQLVTPTSLSNGDDDPLVDLPIVVDALEGKALLAGASLAGALRGYLNDIDPGAAVALFGGGRRENEGAQSSLIVEDALGNKPIIELRDGVSIDPATRTAKDKERYDRQLLAAGTTFDLGFELILTEQDDPAIVGVALVTALDGLQRGDIRLGGRKRRGYGQCKVISWKTWQYDLSQPAGLRGWLTHGREAMSGHQQAQWAWPNEKSDAGIGDWAALKDAGRLESETGFTLSATFAVDGSVLIRSGFEAESGPDVMHLTSHRDGREHVPVMSGTSLAGVIRGQALRIARTVAGTDSDAPNEFVDSMFGGMERPRPGMTPKERRELKKRASRVTVDESVIDGQKDIVQSRVKIDRFTGGAFESALFAEQPAFGGQFTLGLALREPRDAEVGLLLLVLKDLWTGFLPVGGSSSVGRGRLKGNSATIHYAGDEWTLSADGASLTVASRNGAEPKTLNNYVTAFKNAMQGGS